jgi:hypothetical protein
LGSRQRVPFSLLPGHGNCAASEIGLDRAVAKARPTRGVLRNGFSAPA